MTVMVVVHTYSSKRYKYLSYLLLVLCYPYWHSIVNCQWGRYKLVQESGTMFSTWCNPQIFKHKVISRRGKYKIYYFNTFKGYFVDFLIFLRLLQLQITGIFVLKIHQFMTQVWQWKKLKCDFQGNLKRLVFIDMCWTDADARAFWYCILTLALCHFCNSRN